MTLELTDAEAAVIDAGLVEVAEAYGRLAFRLHGQKLHGQKLHGRRARYRDTVNERIEIAERLRGKLLIAKYGEKRAAEIAAERATPPTLEELCNGEPSNRELANGDTRPPCYADNGNAPYCAGRDCPEWGDCHGDKLRGHSDTRGALP